MGLLVGLGLVAVLGLAVVGGGAWYVFGRRAPATVPSASPETTPVAETPPPAPIEATPVATAATTTAEAQPGPAAPTPAAVPHPTAAPASVHVGRAREPQTQAPQVPVPSHSEGAPTAVSAAGDYSYLDELPPETDGRAAGEALAEKYRSGGSSNYSTTRFRARAQFPPGTTPPERPAIGTLLHLHQAEEAYHRKNGRYGNARELADAGFLRVDVPVTAEGFRRARYGFRLTASGDSYRADALPLAANGRAFMVDDSGFVRLPE